MKKVLCLIFLLPIIAAAQEKLSYTTSSGKIEFNVSSQEYYVEYADEKDLTFINRIADSEVIKLGDKRALLSKKISGRSYKTKDSQLRQYLNSSYKRIEPVLIYSDSVRQICTGEIIFKFKDTSYLKILRDLYSITVVPDKFVLKQYIVGFTDQTTEQLFALLSKWNSNKLIEFASPNFIRLLNHHTADPLFNFQWSIRNQGYLGGTPGADMSVEGAWNYATGQNIKVAIIDIGVELNHPDLSANLLPGYDATGGSSAGGPINNDVHGTGCAGIVAAVANNNIGIAGVAYNSKIIPVRIGHVIGNQIITTDAAISDAITWAKNNGADILSNSWGGGSESASITNAINDAVATGRSGKGCVVLFSTGNDNFNGIIYPSRLENVIAVGATSFCDERKSTTSCDGEGWGSNFGTGLDVVAPGVQIFTTDITGAAGLASGDYVSFFNGTSAACPNAAAVMALILSINPNLTTQQARAILESTCDKIGGYNYSNTAGQPNGTWNNEVGYGRVNACAAIARTLQQTVSISGPTLLCNTNEATYTLQNIPAGITWPGATSFDEFFDENSYNTISPEVNLGCATFQVTPLQVTVGNPYYVSSIETSSNGLGGGAVLCNHPYDYDDYANTFLVILSRRPPTSYSLVLHYQVLDSNEDVVYQNSINNIAYVYLPYSNIFPLPTSLEPGLYTLRAWTVDGYCNQMFDWVDQVIEYRDCHSTLRLSTYPNPASGKINVTLSNDNSVLNKQVPEKTSSLPVFELYHLTTGKRIRSWKPESLVNNIRQLNIEGVVPGQYVLVAIVEGKKVTTHVIIR